MHAHAISGSVESRRGGRRKNSIRQKISTFICELLRTGGNFFLRCPFLLSTPPDSNRVRQKRSSPSSSAVVVWQSPSSKPKEQQQATEPFLLLLHLFYLIFSSSSSFLAGAPLRGSPMYKNHSSSCSLTWSRPRKCAQWRDLSSDNRRKSRRSKLCIRQQLQQVH